MSDPKSGPSNTAARSPESKLKLALPFVPSSFAPYHSPSQPPDWITREEVEEALATLVAERDHARHRAEIAEIALEDLRDGDA